MDILVIILRLIHIVAGILWAGGAAAYYLFIEPAAKATTPDSRKFMDHLMTRRRFSLFLNAMSVATILAGGALYYRLAVVDWDWLATGPGIGFTLGGLAGISAVLVWNVMVPPRVKRLVALVDAIQANGGSPSTEQKATMDRIEKGIALGGRLDFALTTIAVLCMATARYWNFQ
jgi:uncharacterized membrane protein